jgi:predicted amidohydrolase YtcJ
MKKLLLIASLALLTSACQEQTTTPQPSIEPKQVRPEEAKSTPQTSTITIVHNGSIYTVDEKQARVEAFAYQDGKIIALGQTKSLLDRYPNATKKDLNGATVVPGLIDAHGHLLGLGQGLMNTDLMGTESKEDIINRLKQQAQGLMAEQWLLGRGWDQNDWQNTELPSAADLDKHFPNRPVWLERVDGHANWGNSMAMAVAKKDLSGSWQPDGGEVVRDANGKATGVFIDNAVNLIQAHVPAPSEAELNEALERAMNKTASVGLTAMHDAGTSLQTWKLLENKHASNQLKVRVYAMADGANEMLNYLCDNGRVIDPEAMLTARSIKLYSDGALGSRGAALLAPYSDAPNNVGLLIESEETLSKHAEKASTCSLQVNIHAIGDRGNRVTLNVLESIKAIENPGRHRIEHSQVIAEGDFQRFKDLNLIASVQPTHATSDMYWAEERVGSERIKGAYAWQTFNKLGIPLALGSDFPVERPAPLPGFFAAIARKDAKGGPAVGWYSEQRLTREQALYGFTLGAAYAAFQETNIGSISVGKYADFVVLSKDIMTIPEAEILNTKVVATYLNGQAIYKQ